MLTLISLECNLQSPKGELRSRDESSYEMKRRRRRKQEDKKKNKIGSIS
jgi:hypothetical protein